MTSRPAHGMLRHVLVPILAGALAIILEAGPSQARAASFLGTVVYAIIKMIPYGIGLSPWLAPISASTVVRPSAYIIG